MKTLYEQLSDGQKEVINSELQKNKEITNIIIRELKKNYYVTALSLGQATELHNIFFGTVILIDLRKLLNLFENNK